ncbi:MAG: putative RiPP precursor [Mesorhizobium sp.]|nr:putative RiPP precursor [Mesorhizobium sp.]TIQ30825.1 MAG: putative RiPP precursor [Mesorhizobium sp.]
MKKAYEKPTFVRKGKLSAITANAPVSTTTPPPA